MNDTKRPNEVLHKSNNINGGRRNTLFNLGPRPSLYSIAKSLPTNTKKRESQLLSMTPYFQETLRRTYDKRQKINEIRRSTKIFQRNENLDPENNRGKMLKKGQIQKIIYSFLCICVSVQQSSYDDT